MALTTTEQPTFFGPADSPLFGVLHLPAGNDIRGGVLMCGSLGKEAMDSARLHRNLADDLARRGLAVLRFDYLGTGDSAYRQVRDDAVANWVASVGHAREYLRRIGAESFSAIGIRAGCLILQEYLGRTLRSGRSHRIERVVYLDPPGTGRRYLREHTTLFRLAVGDEAETPGEVSVIGGRFSEEAASEFAALRMTGDPVGAYGLGDVLVVNRPGETDRHLTALAGAAGVEAIVAPGLPDCARPRDVLLPIPSAAVQSVAEWLDDKCPAGTDRAVPQYLSTATMPAEGPCGADVVERIERIGLAGLFAIRTLPRRRFLAPVKTVIFHVAAKDLHVGPAREWVELSRRIASAGSQAVRWDPAGLGLSSHIDRDPYRSVYRKDDIADAVAVARHVCPDADELELVGICSGSWYAAHTARILGARSAVLVNQLAWSWRVTSTVLSQWYHRKRALSAASAVDTAECVGSATGSRANHVKANLDPAREAAKNALHQHFPRGLLWLLNWMGLVWLPEAVLTTLARRGTAVTVIVSPEDEERFTAKGGRAAIARLRRSSSCPARVIATPTGDHSANHPAVLAAIREAVLPVTGVTERMTPAAPARTR
ncbi:alpha/beta hydrolase [Mycobacterium paraterrae]|uniref:Alpha/beta hydrolase n=1 Tax=Mycobacterium paraterrae TaxID=577492 RepID=A0ABY3VQZ5_9MYCO|nr:hypothetical protein [Mycobacterium paraterrae]UMB69924.1 hypothetical protein MKK62_00705 [Mycobacterium paraterrae]